MTAMDPTPATSPGAPRPGPLFPWMRLDPALQFLLMIGLAAVLALLSWVFADSRTPQALHLGLLAGLAGFAATAIGAAPARHVAAGDSTARVAEQRT